MADDEVINFVPAQLGNREPAITYELGDEIRLHVVEGEDRPYFEHLCVMPLITKRTAPRCTKHEWDPEAVTLSPSVLCPDCGLHGFLTEGAWHPC